MQTRLISVTIWLKHLKYIGLSLFLALALPAYAMTLQQAMTALPQAKSQGVVGEQINGYLGVVRSTPEAESITRLINEARRNEYQRLSRENNIALTDIESMAGQKAIERTLRGHFIQLDGQWIQKR